VRQGERNGGHPDGEGTPGIEEVAHGILTVEDLPRLGKVIEVVVAK